MKELDDGILQAQRCDSLLETAANISSAPEGTDLTKHLEDLQNTILECIRSQDDISLRRAIEISEKLGDIKGATEITLAIESTTESVDIPNIPGKKYFRSCLFAIPVIIGVPLNEMSQTLKNDKNLRALEKSIAAANIADGFPEVHLLNYLYSPTELDEVTPCQVYKLALDAGISFINPSAASSSNFLQRHMGTDTAKPIRQSNVPRASRIDSNVVLRYIVGVFVTKDDTDPFTTAYASDEDSPELNQFYSRLERWQMSASSLVEKCLSFERNERHLAVGPVDAFYLAVRIGHEDYKQSLLVLQMHEALNAKAINIQTVNSMIASFGEVAPTQLRIRLTSILSGSMVAGLVYELEDGEDVELTITRLSHMLSGNGVFSIEVATEMFDPCDPKFKENGFLFQNGNVEVSPELSLNYATRVLH